MKSSSKLMRPLSNARCRFGHNEMPLLMVSLWEMLNGTMWAGIYHLYVGQCVDSGAGDAAYFKEDVRLRGIKLGVNYNDSISI